MSYKKPAKPIYKRILRRTQRSILTHQISVHNQFLEKQGWLIRMRNADAQKSELLGRDIESFGVANFEQVLKRVLLVPPGILGSIYADIILAKQLPAETEKVLDDMVLDNTVSLKAEDLVNRWAITAIKDDVTFYLPKPGVPN